MPSFLALLSKRFDDARAEYHDHIADVKSGYRDIFGRKTIQGRAEDRERRLKARAAMTDEERKKTKRRHVRQHDGKKKTKSEKTMVMRSSSQTPRSSERHQQSASPATDTPGDGQRADEAAVPVVEEHGEHTAHEDNVPGTNPSTGQFVEDGSPGLSAEEPAEDHRGSVEKGALRKSEDSHTNKAAPDVRVDPASGKGAHPDALSSQDDAHTTDQQVNQPTDDSSKGSATEETAVDDEALMDVRKES